MTGDELAVAVAERWVEKTGYHSSQREVQVYDTPSDQLKPNRDVDVQD